MKIQGIEQLSKLLSQGFGSQGSGRARDALRQVTESLGDDAVTRGRDLGSLFSEIYSRQASRGQNTPAPDTPEITESAADATPTTTTPEAIAPELAGDEASGVAPSTESQAAAEVAPSPESSELQDLASRYVDQYMIQSGNQLSTEEREAMVASVSEYYSEGGRQGRLENIVFS